MYSIDYILLLTQMLPIRWRNAVNIAFLKVFINQIVKLHTRFILFTEDVLFRLRMNPQTINLRWGLNLKFDYLLKRITIEDYTNQEPIFVFKESENNTIYLPTFLASSTYDFVVKIPQSLQAQEVAIRLLLDKYRLLTKNYIIQYI